MVLRGGDFSEQISKTDPQKTGKPPIDAQGLVPEADTTAETIRELSEKVIKALAAEEQANRLLLRVMPSIEFSPTCLTVSALNRWPLPLILCTRALPGSLV